MCDMYVAWLLMIGLKRHDVRYHGVEVTNFGDWVREAARAHRDGARGCDAVL